MESPSGIEATFPGARCVPILDPFGNRIRFNEDQTTAKTT
jgi:hypothetical protein